ncbi:unnamed protein product [Sphenostylis stenocarpa]|uniref:Uncharacterized protein n=1 Tax=Sphenostylis stenocarpa TaxID=92480 RepID=A0AA86SWH8_9FABA|nr:unnamed protein product [Sphenostylis stenocarpa]
MKLTLLCSSVVSSLPIFTKLVLFLVHLPLFPELLRFLVYPPLFICLSLYLNYKVDEIEDGDVMLDPCDYNLLIFLVTSSNEYGMEWVKYSRFVDSLYQRFCDKVSKYGEAPMTELVGLLCPLLVTCKPHD